MQIKNKFRKYLYQITNNNIVVIVTDRYNKEQRKNITKQLYYQLNNLQNIIETKLAFENITIKFKNNFVFVVGRFSITNASDDEAKKIICQLTNLNFKNKENKHSKKLFTTQHSFF